MPLHVRHGVWNHGPSEWPINKRDGIWNHRRLDWLLSRLSGCRSKKTSELRVIGLCDGKSTILWRHHSTLTIVCSHDYQRMKPQSSAFVVLCVGNARVSSGFYVQRTSNNESVLMSWHHHGMKTLGISHDACSHFLSIGTILCHCNWYAYHGPLTRYGKLQVAHAPGMPGTFPPAANFKGNR